MRLRLHAVHLVASLLCLACSASNELDSTPGGGGAGPSGSGGASSGVPSTSSGLGVGGSFGGDAGGDGCQKIDFLFVIDNSASMGAYQTQLIDAFGPFMDTIFSTVKAKDYNIMVVDSDYEHIDETCEPCDPDSFWCGDWCTAKASLDLACEKTLGAGEVAPYNFEASNAICGVPGGKRYLTSSLGQSAIEALFPCIAKVGTFGSGAERPMSALVAAVTKEADQGGCNQGFLRDDAVLVVTVISDDYPVPSTDDDASTVGTVEAWYEAIVGAKKGHPENVVMLGILNTTDATCVAGAGDPIVHPTQKFIDLVAKFGKTGIAGNICDGNFNAFFEQAVGLIDTTCDDFESPK